MKQNDISSGRSVFFFRKTLFLWQALFWSSNSLITEMEELAKGAKNKITPIATLFSFRQFSFDILWMDCQWRQSIHFSAARQRKVLVRGPTFGPLPHFHTAPTLPPRLEPQTHPFQSPLEPPLTSRLFTYRGKHFSCFRHSPRFLLCSGGSQWADSLHLFANMRKPIKPSIVAWLTGTSLFLSWEIDLPQASPSPPSSIDNFDRTGGNKETSQVVRLNVPSLM